MTHAPPLVKCWDYGNPPITICTETPHDPAWSDAEWRAAHQAAVAVDMADFPCPEEAAGGERATH